MFYLCSPNTEEEYKLKIKDHVLVKTKLNIVKKTYCILIVLRCVFFHISEMEMNPIIDRVSQFIWLHFSFFMVHKVVIYLRFNKMLIFRIMWQRLPAVLQCVLLFLNSNTNFNWVNDFPVKTIF